MTSTYDRLCESPQTGISLSRLSASERAEVRKIKVRQTSDLTNRPGGELSTVYYLEGDERQAAKLFAEEHRELIEAIDHSAKNVLQSSVSRELYDWILHYIGERELEKLDRVVYEARPDGTRWVIDRDQYEEHPIRRYTVTTNRSVRIDGVSLRELYETLGEGGELTKSDLKACDDIEGDVRYVLEYYRSSEEYDCTPISADGEMAVRKTE